MANKGATNETSLSVMIDMNKSLHHYYWSIYRMTRTVNLIGRFNVLRANCQINISQC